MATDTELDSPPRDAQAPPVADPASALATTAPPPGPPRFSVIVPMLNEEGNVQELTRRVVAALESVGDPFEVVYIDDGSTDATPRLHEQLAASDPRVRVVTLARNYGQEAAVQAGILNARGQWVIQMDGDLQNPPEELPRLIAKLDEGYEIVYGVRVKRKDPLHRVVASKSMVFIMQRLFGIALPKDITTFRIIHADIARFIARMPEKRKFFSALAVWTGARSVSVPVQHDARAAGETKYNLLRLIDHTYDLMVSFSVRPLRLIGLMGALFAVGGIGFALLQVARKAAGAAIPMGWTSLFTAIVVIGGLHLIALSVISEYIARIFIQVQDRPLYRIARRLNFTPDPQRGDDDDQAPPHD